MHNIESVFLSKLSDKINELYGILLYERGSINETQERFALLKDIASLSAELLKTKKNEEDFKQLLRDSVLDKEKYEEKFRVFLTIRNIFAHFPIFDSWEEAKISKDLLMWNTQNGSSIYNFFINNSGQKISFSIYTRCDYFYDKAHEFSVTLPDISNGKVYRLDSFLSFEDALWLFALIGYYLEWKNYKANPCYPYSGDISA